MRHLRHGVLAILAILLAACSGGASQPPASASASAPAAPSGTTSGGRSFLPQVVSSEVGVGANRLVVGLLDGAGTRPIGRPDLILALTFTGPNGEEVGPVEADFIWAIEDEVGLYAAPAEFPVAGPWEAEFKVTTPDARTEAVPFGFDVKDDTSVLRRGETAPPVDTPTADDVGGDLARVSTDDDPEPRFYERSIADVREAGEPFVLAFATPKFCATQSCGPAIDRLKPISRDYPDITFINVEPYQLEDQEGQLQPVLGPSGELQPVPAVEAYGLLSEPYLFVVGADGKIVAGFEAVFGEPELRTALDELTEAAR